MDKKTFVIVGAGKGMGNHIAKKFAENDFRVVLIARNKETLNEYVKEFTQLGMEAYAIAADAADTKSLKRAFGEVREKFGIIDVLAYNAAVLKYGRPTELSPEELIERYQVDVASALYCVRQVLPEQIEKKNGTILFTGGGLALHPSAEYTTVSMHKAALRALAITLNQELKEKGIFTGIVTINGNIEEGTRFAPGLIAETYWQLYKERSECEIVYN